MSDAAVRRRGARGVLDVVARLCAVRRRRLRRGAGAGGPGAGRRRRLLLRCVPRPRRAPHRRGRPGCRRREDRHRPRLLPPRCRHAGHRLPPPLRHARRPPPAGCLPAANGDVRQGDVVSRRDAPGDPLRTHHHAGVVRARAGPRGRGAPDHPHRRRLGLDDGGEPHRHRRRAHWLAATTFCCTMAPDRVTC